MQNMIRFFRVLGLDGDRIHNNGKFRVKRGTEYMTGNVKVYVTRGIKSKRTHF